MCIQYTLKALGQNVLRSVTWLTFKRQIERKEHEQLFRIGFLCPTSQIFYSKKLSLRLSEFCSAANRMCSVIHG